MAGQPITRQRERISRKQGNSATLLPKQAPSDAPQGTINTESMPEHVSFPETQLLSLDSYKHKTGKYHTEYTPEVANMICDNLINGYSLRQICLEYEQLRPSTVCLWLVDYPKFAEQYARAREEQSETLVDQILYIADTCEDPRIAAVRIDARKWIASKLKPKKYGDIRQLDVSGGIDLNVAALNKRLPGTHKQAGPDRQSDAPKGA